MVNEEQQLGDELARLVIKATDNDKDTALAILEVGYATSKFMMKAAEAAGLRPEDLLLIGKVVEAVHVKTMNTMNSKVAI